MDNIEIVEENNTEQEVEVVEEGNGEQEIDLESESINVLVNTDYDELDNKPSINGVELQGNKTTEDLGIDQDFVKDDSYVHTDNNYTTEEKNKLSSLENYDDTEIKAGINSLNENKVNKEVGKGLSTNDYTTEEKNKLASLENYDDTQIVNMIKTKQDKLIAGQGIDITNNVISNTNKSAIWGNISGSLSNQSDLKNELESKADASDIPDVSNFITKDVNNLTNYTLSSRLSTVATSGSYTDLLNKPDLSQYITKTVDDLVNYYKKSETYTQEEVNSLISAVSSLDIEVVETLPTKDISTSTIYLVPKSTSQTNNVYDEYIYVSNSWEKIGDTEIDLSDYVTTSALNTALANYTPTSSLATVATSGDYTDLTNKPTIPTVPTNVSAFTNDAGYTTNTGTITSVKMNGSTVSSSGEADLGTVITDISGKQDVLVSGTNIKTINNTSLLGSGDITISSGNKPYEIECTWNSGLEDLFSSDNLATFQDFYTDLKDGKNPTIIIKFTNRDDYFQMGSVSDDYWSGTVRRLSIEFIDRLQTLNTEYYGLYYNIIQTYNVYMRFDNGTLVNDTWGYNNPAYYCPQSYYGLVGMNNTTAWTPMQDYGIVHKKYVDDAIPNLKVYSITFDSTQWSQTISSDDIAKLNEVKTQIDNGNKNIIIFNTYNSATTTFAGRNFERMYVYDATQSGEYRFVSWSRVLDNTNASYGYSTISANNKYFSFSSGSLENDTIYAGSVGGQYKFIDPSVTYTANYTPTNNYSPATKKYVDDSIPTVPTKVSDLTNDSGFITGMTILAYGKSTWNDFITAYSANKVVYCRASSAANPASGSQTILAFMAYVNNETTPTSVEFQYYRSVNSKSASQQCDQVYVYKLASTNGGTWSVETRETNAKIVAGTGLSSTYSSGTLTLNANGLVNSSTVSTIWTGTQVEYDAITTKDTNTLYFIKEA